MTNSLLVNGNSILIPLKDKSVHCAIFSPPYYNLRQYSTTNWTGGDKTCEHIKDKTRTKVFGNPEFNEGRASREETKLPGYYCDDKCDLCGAIKSDDQIGLEQIPDCLAWAKNQEPCENCFVCSLRKVFKELHRVLRDDGTIWLNLGSSYADKNIGVIRRKNDMMIPHRVALALQADGWIVRNDICWQKSNITPESVKDRFTKSHEYIFLLAKEEKYFFDAYAVAEPLAESSKKRYKTGWNGDEVRDSPSGHGNNFSNYFGSDKAKNATTRNRRSVWDIPTSKGQAGHFASWPLKLVDIMVLAGTSEKGCCGKCGAQWVRKLERIAHETNKKEGLKQRERKNAQTGGIDNVTLGVTESVEVTDLGFEPSCDCNAEIKPSIVLDVFCGTGTTGYSAKQNGRDFIGIDLSMKYLQEIAKPRLNEVEVKLF